MNNVSFLDAVKFCNHLSAIVGLVPCYVVERDEITWDRTADGYRLPTEAEWEYAARAETATRYFFGSEEARLGEYAWHHANAKTIQPVHKKRPNPWGFHDLYGNVWEWCWDPFGPYQAEPQRDPTGSSERDPSSPAVSCSAASLRVLRGGSYFFEARGLPLRAPRQVRPGRPRREHRLSLCARLSPPALTP